MIDRAEKLEMNTVHRMGDAGGERVLLLLVLNNLSLKKGLPYSEIFIFINCIGAHPVIEMQSFNVSARHAVRHLLLLAPSHIPPHQSICMLAIFLSSGQVHP